MGQPNPVAVLDKAVAILRAVADEPATLAELVSRTGLPRATAHRLAVALEGHRLVRRTAGGRLGARPGARRARPRTVPTSPSSPAGTWSTLRDASGESAQFYVRDGATRVCVAAAERTSGLRDTVPVGARLPMTAGLRGARAARLHPRRRGHPAAAVGELHRPHAARGPPPRLGAQRRRARAGRGLAVGAGARRRRAACSARSRSPARSSGWAGVPAPRSSAPSSTRPPRSPAPRAEPFPSRAATGHTARHDRHGHLPRACSRIAEPGEGIGLDELALATRNHGMPLEALRYDVTPPGLHYVLTHYDIPAVDPASWRLEIGGAVRPSAQPRRWTSCMRRPAVTSRVLLECAGNGRARLEPRPVSQPWLLEAVGTAEWTGTPLRPAAGGGRGLARRRRRRLHRRRPRRRARASSRTTPAACPSPRRCGRRRCWSGR